MPKARLLLRMLRVLRMPWLEESAERSCRLRRLSLKVRLRSEDRVLVRQFVL
jgi:hypothetical protein